MSDRNNPAGGNVAGGNQTRHLPETQEKTSLGEGEHNSGVTSNDPAEREEIEKKGTMAFTGTKQNPDAGEERGLSREDLPESDNESRGTTGSGQRQDSN